MQKKLNNYAFIDSQNLNLGIRKLKWKLNFGKFRIYLKEKYGVTRAYIFIGYMPENQDMYSSLQNYGYVLIFKPILRNKEGIVKGNIDADLVLRAMIDYKKYHKAVIVTSDGDFYSLVKYLYDKNKLEKVLSPARRNCSILLKRTAKEKIVFMNNLEQRLKYSKTKKHRRRTKP